MVNLDSVLNAIIPWLVLIFGLYFLYKPLREPIQKFKNWITKTFRKKGDEGMPYEVPSLEYE